MEKVLVIGSNSFSGSNFVNFLLRRGYEVFGCSRSKEAELPFRPYAWHPHNVGEFQFFQADVNVDLNVIFEKIKAHKIGNVYNFSAQSMVGQSWDFPEDWMQTNVVAFNNLLNGLTNFDFLNRYLHVSTPEVYGNTDGYIEENFNYNPSTPYAVSRAAADMSISCFNKFKGFPFCATRASNVYGPGQQLYRIIPKTIHSIMSGNKFVLDGGGKSERDFIFIDDVSDATHKIMSHGKDGEFYHISGNNEVTIKELVERICGIFGVKIADVAHIGPERMGKDGFYNLDCGKIQRELGWSTKTSLNDGLSSTIRWMRNDWAKLCDLPTDYKHKK